MSEILQRQPLCMCYDRYLPTAAPEPGMTPMDRLVLVTSKMWEPGDKITVSFFGGTSTQRKHVIDVCARLMEIANLKFDFITSGVGMIRTAFNASLGAWSMLGKDALGVSRSQPTMNLGFDQPGTYTHEFLHAVAAIHEHQSPFDNPIQWNKPQVYHDLSGPPNNWDRATIDHNMFEHYSATLTNGTTFDPKSVMLYSFPASWTIDGFHVKSNSALSDMDKIWLATKYPGRSTPPVVVPPVVNPPVGSNLTITLAQDLKAGTYTLNKA